MNRIILPVQPQSTGSKIRSILGGMMDNLPRPTPLAISTFFVIAALVGFYFYFVGVQQ